jgi:hypothetical protein
VGKDLNEAKYRADSLESILVGLKANIAYLQEIRRTEVYDEIEGDQREAIGERESNAKKRMEKQIISAILAQIYNISSYLEPGFCPRNEMEVNELIESNILDETLDKWTEEVRKEARQPNIEITEKLKGIRQVMYNTDQKKTARLLTNDQTLQCEVKHELLKEFFDDRWKAGEPINRFLEESIYKLKETINEERKKKIMENLIDFTKMKELIRTRGNLSAPGLDGIANPLLKLEREKGAKMLIELMKMITNTGFCSGE